MKLRAENIMKAYRGRQVVKGISLEVNQGEIVGLLGPNGAGKTTSFYMIVGLIKPNSGNIYLDDMEITKFPMYKRAQNGIGYLAQEASVFRKLSIEKNILSVLQLTSLSKKEQLMKMESLLEEFGLGHIRKNRGDLLSGGERRRTEIARALATDPKFILLDEPFAGVDPVASAHCCPFEGQKYWYSYNRPQRTGNLGNYRAIIFNVRRWNLKIRGARRPSGRRNGS